MEPDQLRYLEQTLAVLHSFMPPLSSEQISQILVEEASKFIHPTIPDHEIDRFLIAKGLRPDLSYRTSRSRHFKPPTWARERSIPNILVEDNVTILPDDNLTSQLFVQNDPVYVVTHRTVSIDTVICGVGYFISSISILSLVATALTGAIIVQPSLCVALLVSSLGFYCMTWMPGWAISRRDRRHPKEEERTEVTDWDFLDIPTFLRSPENRYRNYYFNLSSRRRKEAEYQSKTVPIDSLVRRGSYLVGIISIMSIVGTAVSNAIIIQPILAVSMLISAIGFYFMTFLKE
jgi:hypothetical protein